MEPEGEEAGRELRGHRSERLVMEGETTAGAQRSGRDRAFGVHVCQREREWMQALQCSWPPSEVPEGPGIAPRVALGEVSGDITTNIRHGLDQDRPRLIRDSSWKCGSPFEEFDRVDEDDRLDQSRLEPPVVALSDFLLGRSPCSPRRSRTDVRGPRRKQRRRRQPSIPNCAPWVTGDANLGVGPFADEPLRGSAVATVELQKCEARFEKGVALGPRAT